MPDESLALIFCVPIVVKPVQFVFYFRVRNVVNRAEKFLRRSAWCFVTVPLGIDVFVVMYFLLLFAAWLLFAAEKVACNVHYGGIGHQADYCARFVLLRAVV